MYVILFILLSYLMGSLSGSLLLGKIKNIDIRTMGSGNAGGTNALRSVGPIFALGTIIIDILKGYIPVMFLPYFIELDSVITILSYGVMDIIPIIFGIAAVLGHVYPIFYNFKGGKGAGTLVGVILAIFPSCILHVLFIWILTLILTGYVGLSTILAGITLVIYTYFNYPLGIFSPFGYFTLGISLFLIYTHRENIKRMISGNENQFEKIMILKKIFHRE